MPKVVSTVSCLQCFTFQRFHVRSHHLLSTRSSPVIFCSQHPNRSHKHTALEKTHPLAHRNIHYMKLMFVSPLSLITIMALLQPRVQSSFPKPTQAAPELNRISTKVCVEQVLQDKKSQLQFKMNPENFKLSLDIKRFVLKGCLFADKREATQERTCLIQCKFEDPTSKTLAYQPEKLEKFSDWCTAGCLQYLALIKNNN